MKAHILQSRYARNGLSLEVPKCPVLSALLDLAFRSNPFEYPPVFGSPVPIRCQFGVSTRWENKRYLRHTRKREPVGVEELKDAHG